MKLNPIAPRAIALSFALAALTAAAQPRYTAIKDTAIAAAKSSNPRDYFSNGTQTYFLANDVDHGYEIWRTDGTSGGTALFLDFTPGPDGFGAGIVGTAGNDLVFTSSTGPNFTLWRSDGTTTREIGTFANPEYQLEVGSLVIVGSKVFWLTRHGDDGPAKLWVADLDATGIRVVTELAAGSNPNAPAVAFNGKLYFGADDDAIGNQLWISDGTALGTHMVVRPVECPGVQCGPSPKTFFVLGSTLHFLSDTGLWRTDGTRAGTVRIAQIPRAALLSSSSSVAYIRSARDYPHPGMLWRTDGTANGTFEAGVAPVQFPTLTSSAGVLFYLEHPDVEYQLWKTDGTTATQVGAFPKQYVFATPKPELIGQSTTHAFFSGWATNAGSELWTVDLATGTMTVRDLDARIGSLPFSSLPRKGVAMGSTFVFDAMTSAGREPWVSDGTGNGTKLLKNIAADTGGGMITGTVRDGVTNAPLWERWVSLCTPQASCDTARTNPDGQYRFEAVIPGAYTLYTVSSGYLTQLYDGIDCDRCNVHDGTTVQVQAGLELSGVNFSLNKGGTISGTVTRASTGTPMGPMTLAVRRMDGSIAAYASVRSDGHYTSEQLFTGNYYVETLNNGTTVANQVYPGITCPSMNNCNWASGQPVAVTVGSDTPSIDFALPDHGRITGRVRDASILKGVKATVEFTRVGQGSPATFTTADSAGNYTSPTLLPGSYYVTATHTGFTGIVHPNALCGSNGICTYDAGTPVAVTIGAQTAGIDFDLTPKQGRIIGIIRDRNGTPLHTVAVSLRGGSGQSLNLLGSRTTDQNGLFAWHDVPPGTYYVVSEGELFGGGDCNPNGCSLAGATAILVASGQTREVDMTVKSARTTIRGTIRDSATNQPIAGAIDVHDSTSHDAQGGTYTEDGTYEVTILSRSTTFYVVARGYAHHAVAYPNVRRNCVAHQACPIPAGATALPPGVHSGIDFALQIRGKVQGTVRDRVTGQPLANVRVNIREFGQPIGGLSTDAQGNFSYYTGRNESSVPVQLWVEPLDPDATRDRYWWQVYANHDCLDGPCNPVPGEVLTVADGTVTSGIDFNLLPRPATHTGTISGRIVDHLTGQGMAGVYLSARPYGGQGVNASARTDANGYYVLSNTAPSSSLTPGNYRVFVEPPRPYLYVAYGGNHCTSYTCVNPGSPVAVAAGVDTPGINFRLLKLAIDSVSPGIGPVAGGTQIVIKGRNFTGTPAVTIRDVAATIVFWTGNQIVAIAPPAAPGPANVTVTTGEIKVSLTDAFRYANSSVKGDFDANAKPDLLWRNLATGQNVVWLLDGTSYAGERVLPPSGDANWFIAGVDDFDGNGTSDVVWRNAATFATKLWLMEGNVKIGEAALPSVSSAAWRIAGVGDFNGDHKPDLVWQNATTFQTVVWLLDGTTYVGEASLPTVSSPAWSIRGVGDFNGDGSADLVWRNATTWRTVVWLMNGTVYSSEAALPAVNSNAWNVDAVADYNDDGNADLVWRNAATFQTVVWLLDGSTYLGEAALPGVSSADWQIVGPR